jgi:NDP-sugar pyrophosphorylase family protein
MKALILAGGKGTRLRPLTVYTPKPIVPFLNQPFLLFQLESLRRAGITDITLSLSYQPDKIEQILGDGSNFGVNLQFITEPAPMGTGGAYKFAADGFTDTTIVFNGDILTDVDIAEVIKFHREKKADATIALTPVENPSAYGLVETEADGKVLKFREKPTEEELPFLTTNNINAGIYILEPTILGIIPKGENTSFEYKVFPELLAKEKPFYAFVMEQNYWRDIGNPESYLAAHLDFLNGKIKNVEADRSANYEAATAANVDKNSIIGADCVIKPNAKIINSILGTGVHVEEKAEIENSVIWAHTRVSNSAKIQNAVIGRSCYIGKNAVVKNGAVLGDKTSLTDYTKV